MRTNRVSSSLQELATISGPALAGLALTIVIPGSVYAFVAVTGADVRPPVSVAVSRTV